MLGQTDRERPDYDDGDWTSEEELGLLAESGMRAGWDDPAMDVYDRYDETAIRNDAQRQRQ